MEDTVISNISYKLMDVTFTIAVNKLQWSKTDIFSDRNNKKKT